MFFGDCEDNDKSCILHALFLSVSDAARLVFCYTLKYSTSSTGMTAPGPVDIAIGPECVEWRGSHSTSVKGLHSPPCIVISPRNSPFHEHEPQPASQMQSAGSLRGGLNAPWIMRLCACARI